MAAKDLLMPCGDYMRGAEREPWLLSDHWSFPTVILTSELLAQSHEFENRRIDEILFRLPVASHAVSRKVPCNLL